MSREVRHIFEEFTKHLKIDDLTPEFVDMTSEELLGQLLPLKGSCDEKSTEFMDMVKEIRTE